MRKVRSQRKDNHMLHNSSYVVSGVNIQTWFAMGGVSAKPRYRVHPCKQVLLAMTLIPLMVMGLEMNPSFSPEAVAKYKEKADAGDAEAQYLYARALCVGRGTKKDQSAAFEYAKKSANQGYGLSYSYVGEGYRYGWNGSANNVESAKWYGKFVEWAKPEAEHGHAQAQCGLGDCYCRGLGVERDLKEAVVWYRKAAEQGHAQAQYVLGRCYYRGDGVERDLKEAASWYLKAAERGHREAEEDVAELAKGMGITVEELPWLFAKNTGMKDDKVVAIKKKSEAMKKDTLVFKGMHLGMSVEDARYIIQSFGGLVTSEMLGTKSGIVDAFKFRRVAIDKMFKTEGVSSEAFCRSLLSAYPIIEKLETKYETIADVERQKKYKQDAENAAMRTFANIASNGQDAYELGAAIGSKIRMNANQMTKEVPYYYFESPKGFVLEIHPDRPEMFFVLRSIAAIDTCNFD